MRIYHEFLGNAFVEVNITLWSIVQRYHGNVNRVGDMDLVVEDRFHELAIVFQYWGLPGLEGVALGPTEPQTNRERSALRGCIHAARIIRHVKAGNTDRAACPGELHKRIQYRCGSLLLCICTMTVSFETNAIHCAIYLGATEDLVDLLSQGSFGRDVDSLAAERSGLLQTFLVQIGDDHNRRSQQMTRCRASQSNGTSPGHQHSCPGSDARGNRAVVTGGENVGEAGQISNLFHGLSFVRQLQEIEVGIRNHHVFGLTADPSSHVDISVAHPGPGRVYI